MTGFILRAAIVALGLWLATEIFAGSLTFESAGTLLLGCAPAWLRQRHRSPDRGGIDLPPHARDSRLVPAGRQCCDARSRRVAVTRRI